MQIKYTSNTYIKIGVFWILKTYTNDIHATMGGAMLGPGRVSTLLGPSPFVYLFAISCVFQKKKKKKKNYFGPPI